MTQLIDADSSGENTPDDTMRNQFIITNDGTADLNNIAVNDTIPDGLTYIPGSVTSTTGAIASVNGNALTIVISSLSQGAQEGLFFDVTIDNRHSREPQ